VILCKSRRSAERTCRSITKYVEEWLFLKVNREKTHVGYIGSGMKYLGYSFYVNKGKCRLGIHAKTKTKLKAKLKELKGRSNGMGYEQRKTALRMYMRGWMEYYKLADGKSFLQSVDEWYRRRLRMCIWKCWKRVRTHFKNLMRCGISRYQACQWANTRKGYWRIADSWILTRAITNERLTLAGYPCLMSYYKQLHNG